MFLENGGCSIYKVRPFICRAWNALDMADCQSAFSADTHEAEIEASSARNFVFGLARTVFVELSQQVNLQSSQLEICPAVLKCMDMPDSTALWLSGYPIFDDQMNLPPTDECLTAFRPGKQTRGLSRASEYVNYFYKKYQGRVALGVGYDHNFSQIYPFIFQDAFGRPIGIIAMGEITDQNRTVHIYHIGSFITRKGDGSQMLSELCRKADCFNIRLSVSPVFMPNGKDPQMDFDVLSQWYNRFDFSGESNLTRPPGPRQPPPFNEAIRPVATRVDPGPSPVKTIDRGKPLR